MLLTEQHFQIPTIATEVFSNKTPELQNNLYTIKAGGSLPSNYTGVLMGKLEFYNGIAQTDKHYYMRLALMRGCKNITTDEQYENLKKRNLKSIMVIRNAAWGDCLIMTPFLKALRMQHPDAKIHVFGRNDSKVVFNNLPFIDGVLVFRDIAVGPLVDTYDEVLDLTHTIECNAQADYMNDIDVLADEFKIDIPDKRPTYIFHHKEIENAAKILNNLGVNPQDPNIVIFQAEATAFARTLDPTSFLIIAHEIAKAGYTVVMTGHRPDIPVMRLFKSTECDHLIAKPCPPGINKMTMKSPNLNKDVDYDMVPLHPKIKFAHTQNAAFPARDHFGMAYFAKLILSVDSFWSHLAPAVNKPSVTIFTNYHPYTRVKYYDRCSVVCPDYTKVTCGPCAGLVDRCKHLYGQSVPACVSSISPKEVINEVLKRLNEENSLYQKDRDTCMVENPSDSRPCPCCQSTDHLQITSKNKFIYLECQDCKTMFTHVYPDKEFWEELKTKVKKNHRYRLSRNKGPQFYMSGIIEILKQKKKDLNIRSIKDLCRFLDMYNNRESWSKSFPGQLQSVIETFDSNSRADLVLWVDGLAEYESPKEALKKIQTKFDNPKYIAIVGGLADMYPGANTWPHINTIVAGTNTVIPSRLGLEKVVEELDYDIIGMSGNDDNSIVVLGLKNEDQESDTK